MIMRSLVSLGVLPALFMWLPAPATAAIKPGPVRVVFEQPPDSYMSEGEGPVTDTSHIIYGTDSTERRALTYYGAITWFGTVTRKGKLSFPASKQVSPPPDGLTMDLTGKLRRSGEVTLTGRLKMTRSASTCVLSGDVLLSTRLEQSWPSQVPPGEDYNPDDRSFVLASDPLELRLSGCYGLRYEADGLYLKGRMQLPGQPKLPATLRTLDVYYSRPTGTGLAIPGQYHTLTERIWTSKYGTLSDLTATCQVTVAPADGQAPQCQTRMEPGGAVMALLSAETSAEVTVRGVVTPKPKHAGMWVKSTWTKKFSVSTR